MPGQCTVYTLFLSTFIIFELITFHVLYFIHITILSPYPIRSTVPIRNMLSIHLCLHNYQSISNIDSFNYCMFHMYAFLLNALSDTSIQNYL